jgi:hypothetical protein
VNALDIPKYATVFKAYLCGLFIDLQYVIIPMSETNIETTNNCANQPVLVSDLSNSVSLKFAHTQVQS